MPQIIIYLQEISFWALLSMSSHSGTEQQIIDKIKELIKGCKEGGGYMMAEGCEIAPDTPMKNMKAWINATLKYGTY
ncbi:MAG: uroporphyrinogen decarboxylase family protein [Promethearchaeota archaeon]